MTPPTLDHTIQHLHQWGWQPGTWMHEDWWSHLGLRAWHDAYWQFPACRSRIDHLILQRHGITWTSLPGSLAPQQQALFALEPRLPQLILALGLVALNCPDHLLLKDRRLALRPHLDDRCCDQLLALHRSWSQTTQALPCETLSLTALHTGTRWWLRDIEPTPLRDLLTLRLPPVIDTPLHVEENAHQWLTRIGRFL